MTKRSPEFFAELVAAIAQTGSIAAAAKACRCSVSSVWGWLSSSAKGEPGFDVDWMGETVPLHQAVKQAQRLVSAAILDRFRSRLLHGTDEVARFQGRTVFRRDPALDHLDDKSLEQLGITTRYLKDAEGNFIPEMIHHEPPVQGVLALLAAEFPKVWGAKSTVEINQKSSGVKIVRHGYDQPKAPVPVEVVQEAPALAPPSVDDDLSDLLGEESEPVEPEPEAIELPVPEPQPVIQAEPEPPPPTGLTELQRELLSRLKAGPGSTRSAPVRPTGGAADNFEDGVGPGQPRPGGVKVL
ncbi:hypothetical protein G6321_00050295 [Bradyrhizobium barranii subsp. barranii]|uniref:Uncharacterized protein n=1 Tax=Bradyrhizobium barranii subsp. barranii TaxID=2823807 RepID=A0A7Z0QB50_9BRAD|nr:hypothetical protein [Bradyrhizobium barranii]UGX93687.1 hypothetical protein G6321_00050295 [Bradyrhizobium barranii subsp. barranii]